MSELKNEKKEFCSIRVEASTLDEIRDKYPEWRILKNATLVKAVIADKLSEAALEKEVKTS